MSATEAYAHCRRIARASGSSFYAGMRLLPADRRAALLAGEDGTEVGGEPSGLRGLSAALGSL